MCHARSVRIEDQDGDCLSHSQSLTYEPLLLVHGRFSVRTKRTRYANTFQISQYTSPYLNTIAESFFVKNWDLRLPVRPIKGVLVGIESSDHRYVIVIGSLHIRSCTLMNDEGLTNPSWGVES